MNKSVLLMFSGGLDSFLSTCKLIEQGYKVKLVTYNNGCVIPANSTNTSDRLIRRYGADNVEFLGTHHIPSLVREFYLPIFNLTTSDILETYGNITYSQLNCLMCRTSMYIYSIQLCKELNITILAEGARKSQLFVIELEGMIERYRQLLKRHGIDYLLPVYDLDSDWDRENELLGRGFIARTIEDKCLLGIPLDEPVSQDVINGIHSVYDKTILPRIEERKLIERHFNKNTTGIYL